MRMKKLKMATTFAILILSLLVTCFTAYGYSPTDTATVDTNIRYDLIVDKNTDEVTFEIFVYDSLSRTSIPVVLTVRINRLHGPLVPTAHISMYNASAGVARGVSMTIHHNNIFGQFSYTYIGDIGTNLSYAQNYTAGHGVQWLIITLNGTNMSPFIVRFDF